ncbi:uncharacterized protein METZ01_LOCUS183139, partial [marine metagenome]
GGAQEKQSPLPGAGEFPDRPDRRI